MAAASAPGTAPDVPDVPDRPDDDDDDDRGPPRLRGRDRALRGATVAAVFALAAGGLAWPDAVLRGGLAWCAFLACALSGWGYLIVRAQRLADPHFGLRAVWGAAGYLALAGVLIAAGVCTRPVILGLLGLGAAAFGWRELVTPVATWQRAREGLAAIRAHPAIAAVAIAIGALAVLQLAGAVAQLDRNQWDDDIIYTPLIRRLLDAGDLVEPFSFRRLSAYGGQTALGALAAARGTLANVHLVDHALFGGLALLVIVDKARERRTQPLWTVLLLGVLVALPETAINTGAQWTGVALFVALYRAVARDQWSLVGLIGAAACTLRQNYIAVVVVFVGLVLVHRLIATRRVMAWREAWSIERPRWQVIAGVAIAALAGWWVAAWLSNGTFLFPVWQGTWNHELSIKPVEAGWTDELLYLAWCAIESTPLVIVPILGALLAFTADDRIGRPLPALWLASAVGFVLLVHGFVGTEPSHIWRYAFGFAIALTAIFVLEVGAEHERAARLGPLGRWALLAALLLQLVFVRGALPKQWLATAGDLREAAAIDRRGDPSARVEGARYAALQAAVPAGAALAVVLDQPAYLDYARNPIANLDTPGFASPFVDGEQLPAFRGAEPVREYLVAAGYRYVAYVRPDRSRYFYRRGFWLWRLFNDGDFFQRMSAYSIDLLDSLDELARTTTVRFDRDGLVVLDLGSPLRMAGTRPVEPGSELARRSAWVRELADREGLHAAWSLNARADLRFEDGVAGLAIVDGDAIDDPAWYELSRARVATGESLRGTPIRALYRRAHLRVRGDRAMRLTLDLRVALATVATRPRVDISLDGALLASVTADERGRYAIDLVVPAAALAGGGWRDLYLVFDSIAEPDRDKELRDLRVARLHGVEWVPAP